MSDYKIGDIVDGTITGVEDYGFFVMLPNDYIGLVHISEISNSYVKDPRDYAKVGDVVKLKIIEIDKKTRKMKLSLKGANESFKEKGTGFKPLQDKLDEWIKEKIVN